MKLICGDCLAIMRTLPDKSVDAVITDPPYGIQLGIDKDMRGGAHGLAKQSYANYSDTFDNFESIVVPAISASLLLSKRAAIFSGPNFQSLPKTQTLGGVFCSAASGRHCWGFNTFIPILFYGKDPRLHLGARGMVLTSNARSEKNGHPCPKPLDWMIWLVERTTLPGETVLDPFMGSGTTGVACVQTGRDFIGIEIDPGYFAIAEKRIKEAQAQGTLEGTH